MKIITPFFWRILETIRTKINSVSYSNRLFKKLKSNKIFFIQIGSNDGISQDPIYKYSANWNGILIEPLPNIFQDLKKNYSSRKGNLIFENIAISNNDGKIDLHFPVIDKKEEQWQSKIASVLKETSQLIKHNTIKIEVPCLTLDSLIQKHSIENIDLLIMDIEGYEKVILDNYSFNIKPSAIYIETRFYNYQDLLNINSKLIDLGYLVFPERGDHLYILKES